MHYFTYRHRQLFCEEIPVAEAAEKYGTPLYLYSRRTYRENFQRLDHAFASRAHLICFALKANSNPHLLRDFAELGAGADVVSGGELHLALQAGIPPQRIVFAGVGKRDDEILAALEAGIHGFNVESEAELSVINELAGRQQKTAPVSLRLNPDIDIHGHPYISTGRAADKFGIELKRTKELLKEIRKYRHLCLVGLHAHLGSQITDLSPYEQIGKVLADLARVARALGHHFDYIDVGGGIGVVYEDAIKIAENTSPTPDLALYPTVLADVLLPPLTRNLPDDCTIILEPGRALVAGCGILVTQVLYTKTTRGKFFIVVDAGMTDLIRPSLYGAYHQIVPVTQRDGEWRTGDVVGPICESGDFLAKDRELPPVQRGDFLAVMTAGAYGFTLSSNYNARTRPAEVIVDGGSMQLSRPRQNLESLWKG
ncbi:MAG: diaminopimelate decarboxylase [candidate division KSB1 bacterium]|nr:diaminopimelate decarboxylase [candidate division KSB1 bacterium]MDZ7305291.1 diaminopimelate decarboxylase [candidate division KSB1 bacterium]MDZ7314384.1 diaminopimelate decarboxylase [candidate division KSB1 bacterium]